MTKKSKKTVKDLKTRSLYLKVVLLSLVLIGLILIGLANNSKPGDTLYTVDRGLESLALKISKLQDKSKQARLHFGHAQERIFELLELTQVAEAQLFSLTVNAKDNSDKSLVIDLLIDINNDLNITKQILDQVEQTDQQKMLVLVNEFVYWTGPMADQLTRVLDQLSADQLVYIESSASTLQQIDSQSMSKILTASHPPISDHNLQATVNAKVQIKIDKVSQKLADINLEYQVEADKLSKSQQKAITGKIKQAQSILDEAQTAFVHLDRQHSYKLLLEVESLLIAIDDIMQQQVVDQEVEEVVPQPSTSVPVDNSTVITTSPTDKVDVATNTIVPSVTASTIVTTVKVTEPPVKLDPVATATVQPTAQSQQNTEIDNNDRQERDQERENDETKTRKDPRILSEEYKQDFINYLKYLLDI